MHSLASQGAGWTVSCTTERTVGAFASDICVYSSTSQDLGASDGFKGVFLGQWLGYFQKNREVCQEEESGKNKIFQKGRLCEEARTSPREEIDHSEVSGHSNNLWL